MKYNVRNELDETPIGAITERVVRLETPRRIESGPAFLTCPSVQCYSHRCPSVVRRGLAQFNGDLAAK